MKKNWILILSGIVLIYALEKGKLAPSSETTQLQQDTQGGAPDTPTVVSVNDSIMIPVG